MNWRIKLKMDPLELRLKNDADRDEGKNLPFSSRHLKECYRPARRRSAGRIARRRWAQ